MGKRSNVNGRFERLPDGEKTAKMLELEEKLGCSLEEDYQEYYFKQNWTKEIGRSLVCSKKFNIY